MENIDIESYLYHYFLQINIYFSTLNPHIE